MISLIFTLIGGAFVAAFHLIIFLFTTKIVRIISITITVLIVLFIVLMNVSPALIEPIAASAATAVNITTLYGYSKDVYLDSIINGSVRVTEYTTVDETPYYSTVLSREMPEDAEPLGVLPADTVIELRSIFAFKEKAQKNIEKDIGEDEESGEVIAASDEDIKETDPNVWMQIFFYDEEKPQFVYARLPPELLPAVVVKESAPSAVYATVANHILNVRTGPSTSHDIQDRLSEHTRVEVLEKVNNTWVRIRYDGDKTGYVSSDLLAF